MIHALRIESIHTLLTGWIDSIKGYGSAQDVIDGPHCILNTQNFQFTSQAYCTFLFLDSPLHDAARNGHIKVVKCLVRAGVNLNAKNASGRTPREEAEVTRLRVLDNIDLDKTVSYLIEREESSRWNPLSEVSSESENDDENNDIAKFLGLAKSPVVTQALQTLGLYISVLFLPKVVSEIASYLRFLNCLLKVEMMMKTSF